MFLETAKSAMNWRHKNNISTSTLPQWGKSKKNDIKIVNVLSDQALRSLKMRKDFVRGTSKHNILMVIHLYEDKLACGKFCSHQAHRRFNCRQIEKSTDPHRDSKPRLSDLKLEYLPLGQHTWLWTYEIIRSVLSVSYLIPTENTPTYIP